MIPGCGSGGHQVLPSEVRRRSGDALDFSIDLNLGDITPGKALDKLWLGYYIHYRSAIFKAAQQFGRIEGGSNFQAIYLQYHFQEDRPDGGAAPGTTPPFR